MAVNKYSVFISAEPFFKLVNCPLISYLQDLPPYWPTYESVSLTINDIKVSLTEKNTSDNLDSAVFTVQTNKQVNVFRMCNLCRLSLANKQSLILNVYQANLRCYYVTV